MGAHFSQYTNPKGVAPFPHETPTFDPLFGFPEGSRKERKMQVTEAEMVSAGLELEDRDYCAHNMIKYIKCTRDNFPWYYKCAHEVHAVQNCRFEDHVLRMKEFERERRLRLRERRIAKAAMGQ